MLQWIDICNRQDKTGSIMSNKTDFIRNKKHKQRKEKFGSGWDEKKVKITQICDNKIYFRGGT